MYDPVDKRVTDALTAWRVQLDAGISSHEALVHCADVNRGELSRFFGEAAARTSKGDGIRLVLEPLAPVLSESERAILAAGWNAGRVELVLDDVIKQRETWRITRGQIMSRSAYSLLTLFVAAFLAPFPGWFTGQYGLPIYFMLVAAPLVFIGGLIYGAYAFFTMRARAKLYDPTGAPLPPRTTDRVLLNIPVLNYIERQSSLAEAGTLLGGLLGAGTPIVEALAICARSMSNGCYRESLARVQKRAAEGDGFTASLKKESENLWPNEFVALVGTGEKSGSLDGALLKAGARARDAYLNVISKLSVILPAFIYVLVAIYLIANIFNLAFQFYIKPIDDALKEIHCLPPWIQ